MPAIAFRILIISLLVKSNPYMLISNSSIQLTEDGVVLELKIYLEDGGWNIGDLFCFGATRGLDLEAYFFRN